MVAHNRAGKPAPNPLERKQVVAHSKGARELGEQETISRFNKSKNKTSGGHGRRIQVTVQTKSPNHTLQLQKGGTVTTETFKHQLVLEDVTIYTIV